MRLIRKLLVSKYHVSLKVSQGRYRLRFFLKNRISALRRGRRFFSPFFETFREHAGLSACVRAAMVFFLVYLTLPWGFFPTAAAAGDKKPAAVETREGEGMGGGSIGYFGEIPELESGLLPDSMEGIPEPKEYSQPRMLFHTPYTFQPNDTVSQVAQNFGLNMDTLLSLNGVKSPRTMPIGIRLRIPNQDGVLHVVKKEETLQSIAERYAVDVGSIVTVNELFSEAVGLGADTRLFIPGGRLDPKALQEITGDFFLWPVRGYISSTYGYRVSPFTGARQFHSGMDISAPWGTPVKAAMAGRVSDVGFNNIFGNYVVITHHSGYRTLYGHLSSTRVKAGGYVREGEPIGNVGSTGLSTGPHLHFTVYKNGVTVNPRPLVN
jgi:murein DD-endopeptidase MepM/ murein hydrolase activator NlpD